MTNTMVSETHAVSAIETLKPALISVNNSLRYLGGVSRSKFYKDVLPELGSVLIGGRRLIVVSSLDHYIKAHSNGAA